MYAIDEISESVVNLNQEQEQQPHQQSSVAITIDQEMYNDDNKSTLSGVSRSQSYFQANLPKSRSGSIIFQENSFRGSFVNSNSGHK